MNVQQHWDPICKICVDVNQRSDPPPWNIPIAESRHFVVLPSLGSLVEGWLLIFPKQHMTNLGLCDQVQLTELLELRERVKSMLGETFGIPIVEFEHGGACATSQVACGVSHAHLHLLPSRLPLMHIARSLFPELAWQSCEDLQEIWRSEPKSDYLCIRTINGDAWWTESEGIPSQLFRRVIATAINDPDSWDWRSNAKIGTLERTIERLALGHSTSNEVVTAS